MRTMYSFVNFPELSVSISALYSLVTEQSLEYGQGYKKQYQFDNLEQLLVEKLLSGKPRLQFRTKLFEFRYLSIWYFWSIRDDIQGDTKEKLKEKNLLQQELAISKQSRKYLIFQAIKEKIITEFDSVQQMQNTAKNVEMYIKFLLVRWTSFVVNYVRELEVLQALLYCTTSNKFYTLATRIFWRQQSSK